MPSGRIAKPIEFYVSIAEKLAKKNGGKLQRNGWLMKNGHSTLAGKIRDYPDAFSHIPRVSKITRLGRVATPIEHFVKLAEKLAQENGGKLPTNTELDAAGHGALARAIIKNRELFEHLLPKRGRGQDKAKYELFERNHEMETVELAKLVGVARTTIETWKQKLYEEKGVSAPEDKPGDPRLSEAARFVSDNIPDGWRLEIGFDRESCYLELVAPNGNRPSIKDFEGLDVVESIVAHVNYARKRAYMEPVQWEGKN